MPGKNKTPMLGWHPRSLVLLAWIKAEAERRDSLADVLEEGMEAARVASEKGPAVITEQRITEIVKALNAYDLSHEYGGVTEPMANNVWQAVILPLDEYGEAATDAIDGGQSDRFALTDGSVIRYDHAGHSWWCSRRGTEGTA